MTTLSPMDGQRRTRNDELAEAIEGLRLATTERENAVPGSEAYDDALASEALLNGLVLELVRERNRAASTAGPCRPSRREARAGTNGAA